jgi:hypothetical protein
MQQWNNRIPVILFLVFIALSQIISVDLNNRFSQVKETIRFESAPKVNSPLPDKVELPVYNSTSIHFLVWKYAVQLIGRYPIAGVGVGDVHDELKKVYAENNFQYGVQNEPSPHNQFLQTAVALGIIGLAVLMFIFIAPFLFFIKQKQWLYALFMFVVMADCLTESMLERQAGIIFFTFFAIFFYLQTKQNSISSYDVSKV